MYLLVLCESSALAACREINWLMPKTMAPQWLAKLQLFWQPIRLPSTSVCVCVCVWRARDSRELVGFPAKRAGL